MKKIAFTLSLLLLMAGMLVGQNLYKNEYYLKSLEFRQMADQSYSAGEYSLAYDYAVKSEEYARLSDEYIAKMKAMYQANAKISAASRRIDYANAINLVNFHPSLYEDATTAFADAKASYDEENYEDAIASAQAVIDLLVGISPQGTVSQKDPASYDTTGKIVQTLPKYYTVRLIPERRDCLHRIAEYNFVYSDPYKWEILYKQNKDLLKDPNNPHLIFPGQVFEIPSIKGEGRDGMYDPEIDYPSINDVK